MDKRLRELSNIKIDEQQKQQSYAQIQQRIHRRNWKIPSIILSFCVIIIFLIVTAPNLQQAENEAQISKIVVAKGEANVVSTWQLYVRHIGNEQKIQDFAAIYETLQEVETIQNSKQPSFTIKVLFSNNTFKNYEIFYSNVGEESIFYDKDTGVYYQTAISSFEDLYDLLDNGVNSIFEFLWLVPFFSLLFIQRKIKKKMSEIGVSNNKQFHSSWLRIFSIIVFIISIPLIVITVFSKIHLHFGWLVLVIFPYSTIYLIHEWRHGKNKWRMISYITELVYLIYFFYLFFYVVN